MDPMASGGPATVSAVGAGAGGAAGPAEPMAPASPEPKRPRQRDLSLPLAVARDVTLPELVAEVAELHHRFGRDETLVTAAVDAVDHNAVLLGEVLVRLVAVENKLNSAEGVVLQHKAEATANAEALDLKSALSLTW